MAQRFKNVMALLGTFTFYILFTLSVLVFVTKVGFDLELTKAMGYVLLMTNELLILTVLKGKLILGILFIISLLYILLPSSKEEKAEITTFKGKPVIEIDEEITEISDDRPEKDVIEKEMKITEALELEIIKEDFLESPKEKELTIEDAEEYLKSLDERLLKFKKDKEESNLPLSTKKPQFVDEKEEFFFRPLTHVTQIDKKVKLVDLDEETIEELNK